MNWQEYKESVELLYKKMDDIGKVRQNVLLPDKITGQLH